MLKRMERVNSCPKTPINLHFLILNITWNSKTIKVTNNIESKKFLVSFLTPPKVTRGRLPRIQLSFSSQEAHQKQSRGNILKEEHPSTKVKSMNIATLFQSHLYEIGLSTMHESIGPIEMLTYVRYLSRVNISTSPIFTPPL